jgi:hypothetical protein
MIFYEEERTNKALKSTVSSRTNSRINLEHTSIVRTGNQEVVMATETVAETWDFCSEFTLNHSLVVQIEALLNVGIYSELMPHYSLEVETDGFRNAEHLFRINAAKYPDDGERDSLRNLGYFL